jgi:hypothetical protein
MLTLTAILELLHVRDFKNFFYASFSDNTLFYNHPWCNMLVHSAQIVQICFEFAMKIKISCSTILQKVPALCNLMALVATAK